MVRFDTTLSETAPQKEIPQADNSQYKTTGKRFEYPIVPHFTDFPVFRDHHLQGGDLLGHQYLAGLR